MIGKGRFVKGHHYSPSTEFKKGQSWREQKPYWNRDWLYQEYVIKQRSAGDIAQEFSVTTEAILFWLHKLSIPRRKMEQIRKLKHWGASGKANGMYDRRGKDNPNWKGGLSPERQTFYSSLEWSNAIKSVWKRDASKCRRCGGRENLHIHHIISFPVKEYRTKLDNLVLLCKKCHNYIHSRKNTEGEFIEHL